MFKKVILPISLFSLSFSSHAFQETQKGKIVYSQGHVSPTCRTVQFKENGSGGIHHFRIADVQGDNDINATILTALVSNRDVKIAYEPGVTSGCGYKPRITFVTIY